MHSITMRFSIVFLALFALAAAIPATPKYHAADQELLKKQQDVIYLLENIAGELPNQHLREIGYSYEFEPYLQNYENPSTVKYYVSLVKTGHAQPQGTPYSDAVSQLRKEVALLVQIFLGAKDYETFLNTAAWARVHVNQDQFVNAFAKAILQRKDLYGVILPPAYEVFPYYFFDTRIIQKVQDYVNKYGLDYQQAQGEKYGVYTINVNYTSYYPFGENEIAYFTEDIGLNAYYGYVQLAHYMIPYGGDYAHKEHGEHYKNGHGAHYYYIHQQLLARYNLERLGQGLAPIKELDYYYEHIETPYKPNFRYTNGVNFPGRDEHHYITPRHHNYELVKLARALEQRILDAIHLGHVITPQGAFLSLYQPEGLNILGELIEGTGRSINPRYYGSFQYVARQLLGNAPEFNNIYEYSPSALELGQTAVRDPIFYQLYSKIIELFHYYQEALPAYQYNDVVVPGVNIEKVEVGDLVTYFSDYEVDLNNAVVQPVGQHQEYQPFPKVKANLKRLDHKQYEYTIYVQAKKVVPGAVVRVYVGPKYNYDGQPIDISQHRHYFYELDQFVYDITEGQNVITRNSHQFAGQSYDYPSVQQLKESIKGAYSSQSPYYINYPEQLYGFPARLTLPKGSQSGFPLQFFFIITAGTQHQPEHYGPVVEEQWQTYQPYHYQIVGDEEYKQFTQNPVDTIHGGYQTIEVIPDFDSQIITEGNWHWGYLYKKYPGSYYYPHWQQTYYSQKGGDSHHYGSHYKTDYPKHGATYHYGQGGYHGQEGYHGQYPYAYQKGTEQPEGGKYQTYYKQGAYHGSGYYPGGHYSQSHKGQSEYVHNYYQNKYIGDVIGGAVSFDNKPFGYPFDRPIADSAFYAHNIYIQDVYVYHHNEYIPEY
ncbi:hexamerin [Nasonia vitripennis]|uniref:Uncharacterized protein n=1 Tax=Nasonia vitripennis TaxID=7425 RepID=A0A7M7G0T6_NASVI|nr:hexamerin [Nasonia vitripennis]